MITFLLMIPVLMGFMVLSLEGGRYLRLKSAVADSAEVAGLAVSARQSLNPQENAALATRYVQALVPDAQIRSIDVSLKDQARQRTNSNDFLEYRVQVTTEHESWFPKITENSLGFDKTVTLSNSTTIRKYKMPGSDLLDVVFVPDFSNPHDCSWDSPDCKTNVNWKENIELIKSAISRAAQNIQKQTENREDKNTVALVPFNYFTADKTSASSRYNCYSRQEIGNSVDKTIDSLFEEKECVHFPTEMDVGSFHTIPLTEDIDGLIGEMTDMTGGWNSSSFEGIIRANQIALAGKNPNRIIIIISTAKDSNKPFEAEFTRSNLDTPRKFHQQLNKKQYCDLILDELNSLELPASQTVNSGMYAVGFGHNVNGHQRLRNCVGKDNLLDKRVDTEDELYNVIMNTLSEYQASGSLIKEEVGRVHNS